MAKLTDYQADSRFTSGDILIKDGSNGTRKITAADAAVATIGTAGVDEDILEEEGF